MGHRQSVKLKSRSFVRVGASALFLMGLSIGFTYGVSINSWAKERYSELKLFAQALNLVQRYYVKHVDTKKLIYGGIKGMLNELDPHTNFLEPDTYKQFESETAGKFSGLGLEITEKNGILTVISPIEDTPAFNVGIKPGDKIVEINGESTKGMTLVEVAHKMRGKKGSKIELGIFREGFQKLKQFSIVRDTIKIRSVKMTDLENGYIYIKLTSFVENTSKEMKRHIKKFIKKNKKISGMVIDLRRNPGGLFEQAIKISDMFLKKGIIVSTMGRNKKQKEVVFAKGSETLPNFPLVVLVDGASASASEIVAGAFQDHNRALILGEPTFGKGTVQTVAKLEDKSGMKMTVALYYTPSGKPIQAEGIIPDVKVDNLSSEILQKAKKGRGRVRREKDIKGHLLSELEKEKKKNGKTVVQYWWADTADSKKKTLSSRDRLLSKDFQVLQAYNYLRAWKTIHQFNMKPSNKK